MNLGKRGPLFVGIATLVFFYSAGRIVAQTRIKPPNASDAVAPPADRSGYDQGSGKVGAGFRMSSLGFGGEVAAEVTHSTNIRGGINFFSSSRGYNNDGIHYAGDLRWFSAEAHYDWFPFAHALHLSPGVIAYNDNHVNASASVPGGNSFTLNGVEYESEPANPVSGSAKLSFNKIAPTVMIGLGNLVPRNGKHFSVNIEGGVAFQGSPKIALHLAGGACTFTPLGPNCQNVATNSAIQSNVQGEQSKISDDLSPFKYYPLISLTIGYRF
ncbi:MAG: hypothetical protein DMG22_08880 [Acidobacteria bacterium]|nr:MAG: hypothetical protein DMG22_08880 [Acidobacteriota bacterium]